MIAGLLTQYRQLPSIQVFFKSLLDDFVHSRSIVVYVPTTIDPNWLRPVIYDLLDHNFTLEEIDVGRLQCTDGVAAALGDAIGVQWPPPPAPRDISSLISCDNLPEIVLLRGIESLNASDQEEWCRFVQRWAQISQNMSDGRKEPSLLFVIVHWGGLRSDEITSDVRLAVHWWWGIPSALELKLLCRSTNMGHLNHDLQDHWREHLLPTIAGSDLELYDRLWYRVTEPKETVMDCLRELARERNWTYEYLNDMGANLITASNSERQRHLDTTVPFGIRKLWAIGAAYATHEYGIELHPSALLVLGQEDVVEHRLWRGQAELLLPLLDSIRLDLCTILTQEYGASWPVRWLKPERPEDEAAVRENPLACDWGYLYYLIKHCDGLRRERRWLSLVKRTVRMRNELAHYRSVSFKQYQHVIAQLERAF